VLVLYLLADGAIAREPDPSLDTEMSDVLERSAALSMTPLVLAAAFRLGSLRESLGDTDGARAAFERAAGAADALAASLPGDLREMFEAKPDVAELRQRLMPA
jgi:hypothetical protein